MTKATLERFWEKVDCSPHPKGCQLWTASITRDGYGLFAIGRKHRLAHRVSMRLTHGSIPSGVCVLHKCDTPACVNPKHLFFGSLKDNSRDMVAKGRHGSAKLTPGDVRKVRKMRATGMTQIKIARRFGVTQSTISGLCSGKHWSAV